MGMHADIGMLEYELVNGSDTLQLDAEESGALGTGGSTVSTRAGVPRVTADLGLL